MDEKNPLEQFEEFCKNNSFEYVKGWVDGMQLFLLATTVILAVIARVQHEVIKKHNSPENKRRIFREVALENSKKWSAERYV
ncbi:TPA: hypothetical protein VER43_001057 [Streptococcus pyogenes]|nr:hypothetical protein [Streptococcus pyogenes]HEQ2074604.1 hypothetical protein [Streptococcus pyogenes]HEQ2245160.1 hypothetical protein [Streptococcus pyogenes]HEQ2248372.1 hypothetical protein [Streptococcus pyogenes]